MRLPRQSLFALVLLLAPGESAEAQVVFSPPPAPVTAGDFALWSDTARTAPSIRRRWDEDRRAAKKQEWQFLTPKGRAEILIKRHLSPFDTAILNRFVLFSGVSSAARAAQAEETAKWDRYVDETRERLDLVKLFDPAYARQMRKEFFKTEYRRLQQQKW